MKQVSTETKIVPEQTAERLRNPNRRAFFGMVAALPVVGPAIAAAAAAPRLTQISGAVMSGEFVVGVDGGGTDDLYAITRRYSPSWIRARENLQPIDAFPGLPYRTPRFELAPAEPLRMLFGGPARSDTPNRLHGAYINADGDAV